MRSSFCCRQYLKGAALALGLVGATHAQNLAGPPQPRDSYECSRYYEPIFAQLSRELRDWEQGNCGTIPDKATRNHSAYKACYERLTQMRRTQHQQVLDARNACFERARDVQQQEAVRNEERRRVDANAIAARQESERSRVTTIPLTQHTHSNQRRSEISQQKINDASQAIGALFSKIYEDKVEKELGAGSPNSVSQAVAANNERAFGVFEMARDRFNFNPVIKKIQDLAWDQLRNEVRVVTEQLDNFDRDIQIILAQTPSLETVMQAPNRRTLMVPFKPGSSYMFEYEGQLDEQERPHGLGLSRGKNARGWDVRYFGNFTAGLMDGYGVYENVDSDGFRHTYQGKFNELRIDGTLIETRTELKTGRFSVFQGQYGAKKANKVLRIRFAEGDVYEGQVDADAKPSGIGTYIDNKGTRTTFSNGGALIEFANGTLKKCVSAIRMSASVKCFGPALYEYKDGRKFARHEGDDSPDAGPSYFYSPANGGTQGYVEECFRPFSAAAICRRTWDSGHIYEGEVKVDQWGNETVGTLTLIDGTVSIGRWVDRKLVDGVRIRPDGSREKFGNGTVYDPPRLATSK